MIRFTLVLLVFVCSSASVFAEQPILNLIYKDAGKPPYIQTAPDSSGLYYDMMKRAAEKIGFQLEVIRAPKKRTYLKLEQGTADLYASGQFKDYRSEFLYYFPNGLYRREEYYGLTSMEVPELSSIQEINQYRLKWLVELGSSQTRMADEYGVKYYELEDAVNVDKAIQLISLGRPFIYRIIIDDLKDYMKNKKITSMEDVGVRIQRSCFKTTSAELYTSFSRFSPHYKEQLNPSYNESAPLNAENFPFELVPGTVPFKFKQALQEMIISGEVDALKRKYLIK